VHYIIDLVAAEPLGKYIPCRKNTVEPPVSDNGCAEKWKKPPPATL
jgi:hypothetical protein